jgi:hypothetical protein
MRVDFKRSMAKPRKRPNGDTSSAPPNPAQGFGRNGSATATPDPERISHRAYELYLARGGADGRDKEDWLAAERELTQSEPSHSHGDSGE